MNSNDLLSESEVESQIQLYDLNPNQSKLKRKNDKLQTQNVKVKYFQIRRNLQIFSKFYEGILGDDKMVSFATPEVIAKHVAERATVNGETCLVLDPFSGYAGNAIQFALARPDLFVLAIELNANRIKFARNNAKVYGVEHRIEFILGDSMKLMETCRFKPDVVFLSPPWGGKKYKKKAVFCLKHMPINGKIIFEKANALSSNICYYLPKQQSPLDLSRMTVPYFEIEEEYLDDRLIAIVVYYGNLIKEDDDSDNDQTIKKIKRS